MESQLPRTCLPYPPSDSWCSLPPDLSLERAHEGKCCYSLFVALCKVSIGGKTCFLASLFIMLYALLSIKLWFCIRRYPQHPKISFVSIFLPHIAQILTFLYFVLLPHLTWEESCCWICSHSYRKVLIVKCYPSQRYHG